MSIVQVEDVAPLNLHPSVSSGTILLTVKNAAGADVPVPPGDSVRDFYHPPAGVNRVEARVHDNGGTAFTVTDADGSTWTRSSTYCKKTLTVATPDNAETSYPVTIAATGATTRNQTIIIKRKPL